MCLFYFIDRLIGPESLKKNTLILVDFDDTLFPTSAVGGTRLYPLSEELADLAEFAAVGLLRAAATLGEVVILTASCPEADWMNIASRKVLPKLNKSLLDFRQIYSRRVNAECKEDPESATDTLDPIEAAYQNRDKLKSFKKLIDQEQYETVLSLSDASIDLVHFQEACESKFAYLDSTASDQSAGLVEEDYLGENTQGLVRRRKKGSPIEKAESVSTESRLRCKAVHFAPEPSALDLISQLRIATAMLPHLVTSHSFFDPRVELDGHIYTIPGKSVAERPNQLFPRISLDIPRPALLSAQQSPFFVYYMGIQDQLQVASPKPRMNKVHGLFIQTIPVTGFQRDLLLSDRPPIRLEPVHAFLLDEEL